MDRLFTRRGVMIGAGAAAASLATIEPTGDEPTPIDQGPAQLTKAAFDAYMGFNATLRRGGSKPLAVTIDISASDGLASVNIRSLTGPDVMWGAIESQDPAVCDFLAEVMSRIYAESRQIPDFFPTVPSVRSDEPPEWRLGHWIQCPDCDAWREYYCTTCDDRGCVWEAWVTK